MQSITINNIIDIKQLRLKEALFTRLIGNEANKKIEISGNIMAEGECIYVTKLELIIEDGLPKVNLFPTFGRFIHCELVRVSVDFITF